MRSRERSKNERETIHISICILWHTAKIERKKESKEKERNNRDERNEQELTYNCTDIKETTHI